MIIRFNGADRDIDAATTIADLLGPSPARGVAVAVNKQVVPRSRHAETTLADGDVVDIVTAVQGG